MFEFHMIDIALRYKDFIPSNLFFLNGVSTSHYKAYFHKKHFPSSFYFPAFLHLISSPPHFIQCSLLGPSTTI